VGRQKRGMDSSRKLYEVFQKNTDHAKRRTRRGSRYTTRGTITEGMVLVEIENRGKVSHFIEWWASREVVDVPEVVPPPERTSSG
jgi:hypothetical protein